MQGGDRTDLERQWNAHPGMRHMGARLDLSTPGVVRAVIDRLEAHHRGGLGGDAVNGAVIAGLLDVVLGLAGYLERPGARVGVAQLHVHYLRPVLGDRLVAEGRPTRTGRNLIFVAGELRDERGELCASADGIVAVTAEGDGRGVPAF